MPDRRLVAAALASFGWDPTDEFWRRYHSDALVYNLANALAVEQAHSDRGAAAIRSQPIYHGLSVDLWLAEHDARRMLPSPPPGS